MVRLSRNNSIRLLLVAAAIHLLGACPCGCLEHNGWRLTALLVMGGDDSVPAEDEPCEDGKSCHDAMMVSSRAAAPGTETSSTWVTTTSAPSAWAITGASLDMASAAPFSSLDQPSIARLQVLRL
ncbi:hypothetical protein Pla108_03700 [Botrimarina colliarenosi]|uniref:Secreted protein n=1 Tax=Botrimarina colliarenosi TaxID=2528001 RepID=A0A5C6AK84_9BACT|nr:hypothetical protein [Botrimarina colliarenosi]TWT99431.1 hypothetical protein Pla108_03700 [Botrimarina colliarenosi]